MRGFHSIARVGVLVLFGASCTGGRSEPAVGSQPRAALPGFTQLQEPLLERRGGGLVYDSARQRLVLLGLNCAFSVETREWAGSSWCRRAVDGPAPAIGSAVAYDSARRRVVVFSEAETWEWDGATWIQRAAAMGPPARMHHAMTYDARRRRVVLFGGAIPSPSPWSVLGDTWEWDGTTWTERTPSRSPSPRGYHAMAYDPARLRTVLFGGVREDNNQADDTWEWDGTTWIPVDPPVVPPARRSHVMAYDGSAGRVVRAGGFGPGLLDDVWDWDGRAWSPRVAAPSHFVHGLAFDESRDRLVLYGHDLLGDGQHDVTWEWDGQGWTTVDESESPGYYRSIVSMAYLPGQERLVLFGGAETLPYWIASDTWEWDGATWNERHPATAAARGIAYAMASDERRQTIVLFGGYVLGSRQTLLSGDTWEWDGTDWYRRQPTRSPPPRSHHAMAYDAARERIVMFGGDLRAAIDGSTWEWNGEDWTDRTTGSGPAPRSRHALAYDAIRERMVLFGGVGHDDTWEWDGLVWQQVAAGPMPPRYGHTMTYDGARQRTVLIGGTGDETEKIWEWDGIRWTERATDAPPSGILAAAYFPPTRQVVLFNGCTWIFADPAHVERFGAACPGTGGAPSLAAFGSPSIGNAAFALDVVGIRPFTTATVWLAQRPARLPARCELLVDTGALITTLWATANQGGFASVPFPIPPTAQSGMALFLQAAVIDPAAPGGVALTQGLKLTVGQ